MKQLKIILLGIIMIWSVFMLAGCFNGFGPGTQDYEYNVGTGYKLYRISGHNIVVAPDGNWSEKPVIEAKVTEIAWDERYVLAKQLGLKRVYPDNPNNTYEVPAESKVQYFILDTVDLKIYGGYNLDEFTEERKALGISDELKLEDVSSYPKDK